MPAMAMTAAERDMCKRMEGECVKNKMSHSCCQTTTGPDHLPAIKSSADASSNHLALVLVHALPSSPAVARMPESGSSLQVVDIHSLPVSPPVTISVLRI